MRDLAQTNLQLYEQLMDLAWEPADLAEVRRAYDLACHLFSGRYRPSGKTFVAHVVGTASCVAAVDGRPTLVKAALLHAAYEQGDFGSHVSQERRRTVLRATVDAETEALVSAYAARPWYSTRVERHGEGLARASQLTRDVLLLRLANEVDEHVDRGAQVADRDGFHLYSLESVHSMEKLAIDLGYPDLAELLQKVSDPDRQRPIPAALRSSATASSVRPPASYRLSLRSRTYLMERRLRRTLSQVPGARSGYRQLRSWSRSFRGRGAESV